MDEKERLMENIVNKRRDILMLKDKLKRLNSETEEMEGQVARDTAIVEAFDKNIRTPTSSFQILETMHLMDRLI